MSRQQIGKVTIAGAGPGDAELITIKLLQRLGTADVIISDRLVNPSIISRYANPLAKVLQVGKEGYNSLSTTQEEINNLLVNYALQGHQVLRLKGGDVAIFSNVLDELETLAAHNIEFEIIPGITAASGASAYTGIPLTARGHAQGVQFITYSPNSHYSTEKWKYLASCSDTLVFYMSTKNVLDVAELLLRYSKKPTQPLAVIEQAATPYQQVHLSSLGRCHTDFANKEFSSPSLIITGEVVNLYHRFQWQPQQANGTVFKPLTDYQTV